MQILILSLGIFAVVLPFIAFAAMKRIRNKRDRTTISDLERNMKIDFGIIGVIWVLYIIFITLCNVYGY